ncbi:hypothetical protein [Vibrio bathopelagicus]
MFFTFAGCQSTASIYPPSYKVLVAGDTLVYDGMITGDTVLEALRVVRENNSPTKKVKITNLGGYMEVGIEFGYFIKEHISMWKLVSYAFLPVQIMFARSKSVVINTNSLIGWHGGAKQSDELWELSVPKKDRPAFMAYLNRLRIKETPFFRYVDVDQQITSYGQTIKNSCQVTQKTDGWYYAIEDRRRKGIKDIIVKGVGLLNEI